MPQERITLPIFRDHDVTERPIGYIELDADIQPQLGTHCIAAAYVAGNMRAIYFHLHPHICKQ